MLTKKLITLVFACLVSFNACAIEKSTLEDDLQSGYDTQCIDWKIIGSCVWMKFHIFSVSFHYSSIVSHYTPDAIVEVFHDIHKTPLEYTRLNHKIAKETANGILRKSIFHNNKLNNTDSDSNGDGFHDVQIVGNPLIKIHDSTIGKLYNFIGYCPSAVTPFMTYIHTQTDPEWRLGYFESINYFTHLHESITNRSEVEVTDHSTLATSKWGSLYPRTGYTNSPSPFIAASIAALRAGVLVTKGSAFGTHIKQNLPSRSNVNGRSFDEPKISLKDGKWKVLVPSKFSGKQCSTFPLAGVSINTGTNEPISDSRNYVYQVWRKYQCCKKKGHVFISSFKWGD